MTDDQRREDIDRSLQQWVRAMIAKGHPAGLVKERIQAVRGLGIHQGKSRMEAINAQIDALNGLGS